MLSHSEPTPHGRALAAGISLVGVVASPNLYALSFLLAACVLILLAQGKITAFLRFTIRLWLPLAIGLFIVWGLIIKGSPGTESGAGFANGVHFAALVSIRVATLAALFQAAVLSLEGLRLARFLRSLGVSPTGTATVVSIINLWPDFARRSEQVVAARCARGLMTDRRLWTRVRQIPWIVRTLFVGSLGHSLDRAARWQAESLPQRLSSVTASSKSPKSGLLASFCWCVAAMGWTSFALLYR